MDRFIRLCWNATWRGMCWFRTACYRALPGTFFEGIGRGTKFFGWSSFGTCNGNISIGKNCLVGRHVFFSAHKKVQLKIADNCSINTGCHLVALYGIEIGEGTRIAEFCSIRDQNHRFDTPEETLREQGFDGAPIIIGKDCWIGRGVFIGPGVTIGDGCVVGANAVVIRDIPPFSVAVGVPAKVVRSRKQLAP